MNRRSILVVSAMTTLGLVLLAGNAVSQQTLKEQLVGTWTLISAHSAQSDGSKIDLYGPNASGILIYTSDGHFALVDARSDLPKFAGNSRVGNPEENKTVVQGSIAY